MKVRFIHVGCHRCGSTFLQERVMPNLRGTTPVTYRTRPGIVDAIDELVLCAEPFYDLEANRRALRRELADAKDLCLSFEGFSGLNEGLGPGYQIGYIPGRLREVFGPTRILIIIREQRSVLISRYRANVVKGLLAGFEPWVDSMTRNHKLNFLRYSPLIQVYADAFGMENVKVALFEELMNPTVLAETLEDLGVPDVEMDRVDFTEKSNASPSAPALAATRLVNRFFGSKMTHAVSVGRDPHLRIYNYWRDVLCPRFDKACRDFGFSSPRFDVEGLESRILELCHEDNERVAAMTGLDLRRHDYP